MRKAVAVLLLLVLASGTGWYLGKHDVGEINPSDFASLFQSEETSFQQPQPNVARTSDTVRVASFNIQVFGTTKAGKAHVMDILARIVRDFDVVAIQEMRSRDQSVVPQFVDLINATGRHYDYAIGPRLGRTSSQEQYVYLFDTASVEIDRNQLYTIDDPDDLLHREPYVAWFRVRGPPAEQAFTFTLINLHTDPDEVDVELNVLDDVYRVVRDDGRNEDDVIVLGDLNAGDKNMGDIKQIPGITWVVSNTPTNTRGTAQYDNLVFHSHATREFTGRGGVFDFLQRYNLTMEEALEVSDHMPVWAEFSVYEGGRTGQIASVIE